jgi:hypothetical protein
VPGCPARYILHNDVPSPKGDGLDSGDSSQRVYLLAVGVRLSNTKRSGI